MGANKIIQEFKNNLTSCKLRLVKEVLVDRNICLKKVDVENDIYRIDEIYSKTYFILSTLDKIVLNKIGWKFDNEKYIVPNYTNNLKIDLYNNTLYKLNVIMYIFKEEL
jgi:hypothetical protein